MLIQCQSVLIPGRRNSAAYKPRLFLVATRRSNVFKWSTRVSPQRAFANSAGSDSFLANGGSQRKKWNIQPRAIYQSGIKLAGIQSAGAGRGAGSGDSSFGTG